MGKKNKNNVPDCDISDILPKEDLSGKSIKVKKPYGHVIIPGEQAEKYKFLINDTDNKKIKNDTENSDIDEELKMIDVIIIFNKKSMLKDNGLLLKNMTELQEDREAVLLAVKNNGMALCFAEKFKNDEEIVLEAIKSETLSYIYAEPKLLKNYNFIQKILQNNGLFLEYLSDKHKKDHNFAMTAVKNNGWALAFVDPKLRKDETIIETATITAKELLNIPEIYNEKSIVKAIDRYYKDTESQIYTYICGISKIDEIDDRFFVDDVFVERLQLAANERICGYYESKIKNATNKEQTDKYENELRKQKEFVINKISQKRDNALRVKSLDEIDF